MTDAKLPCQCSDKTEPKVRETQPSCRKASLPSRRAADGKDEGKCRWEHAMRRPASGKGGIKVIYSASSIAFDGTLRRITDLSRRHGKAWPLELRAVGRTPSPVTSSDEIDMALEGELPPPRRRTIAKAGDEVFPARIWVRHPAYVARWLTGNSRKISSMAFTAQL